MAAMKHDFWKKEIELFYAKGLVRVIELKRQAKSVFGRTGCRQAREACRVAPTRQTYPSGDSPRRAEAGPPSGHEGAAMCHHVEKPMQSFGRLSYQIVGGRGL
jgi:hypothetical protein